MLLAPINPDCATISIMTASSVTLLDEHARHRYTNIMPGCRRMLHRWHIVKRGHLISLCFDMTADMRLIVDFAASDMAPRTPRPVVSVDLSKRPVDQAQPLHNRWHPDIPPVRPSSRHSPPWGLFTLERLNNPNGEAALIFLIG